MKFLEKQPDNTRNWRLISSNPNITMEFIEKYIDKINVGILSRNMLKYHSERLYYLLTRHYKYTGSNIAFKILSNFNNYINSFKLVLPTDYKRALSDIESSKNFKLKLKG